MIPLLAVVFIEATLAEVCAGIVLVGGAVKLVVDTVEVVQRISKAARETKQ